MAEVEWSEDALASLDAICLYIATESPHAAEVLASRMFEAADDLALFPHAGRVVPESGRDDVRELIVGSYRLIYRVRGDQVRVALVWHGARLLNSDPGQLS